MSTIRVMIGVLAGTGILAGEIAAFWRFGLDAKWLLIVLFILVGLAAHFVRETQVRKALRPYWDRSCTGFSLAAAVSKGAKDRDS